MTHTIDQTTGQRLAAALAEYARTDTVVPGVASRGLALAAEVAAALSLPLDVVAVQKIAGDMLGRPHVGAVAEPDHVVLNQGVLRQFAPPPAVLETAVRQAIGEVERRTTACRGDRARCEVAGRRAIVVADSAGMGTTLRAAIAAVRALHPCEVVVALAVAPMALIMALREEAGRVVCLATPQYQIVHGIHESLGDGDGNAAVRRVLEQSPMSTREVHAPASGKR